MRRSREPLLLLEEAASLGLEEARAQVDLLEEVQEVCPLNGDRSILGCPLNRAVGTCRILDHLRKSAGLKLLKPPMHKYPQLQTLGWVLANYLAWARWAVVTQEAQICTTCMASSKTRSLCKMLSNSVLSPSQSWPTTT